MWSLIAFVLLLLGALVLVCLATAAVMAWVLIHPPRMSDGKAAWVLKRLSPGDLSLPFQPLGFTVTDHYRGGSLDIAAWWIPAPAANGRCIVLLHGYADAKVGAIAWAPLLNQLGWNLLVLDLRGHGESGGGCTTIGYYERHDINQVIDQFRAQRPDDTRTLVLYGLSMGAAVAIATAALRTDLAGIVLDSPFSDYRRAERAYVDLVGLPATIVLDLAQWLIRLFTGGQFDQIAPCRLLGQIPMPLMLIHSGQDLVVSPPALADIETALAARRSAGRPTTYWKVPDSAHLLTLRDEPDEYCRKVGEFLVSCTVAGVMPDGQAPMDRP